MQYLGNTLAGDLHCWLPEFGMVHNMNMNVPSPPTMEMTHLEMSLNNSADVINVNLLILGLNFDCSKLCDFFRNWASGTIKSAKMELGSLASLMWRFGSSKCGVYNDEVNV
jgi:hypothetical protein